MEKTNLLFFIVFLLILQTPESSAQSGSGLTGDIRSVDQTPSGLLLSSAYPNPFNPETRFMVTSQERQEVSVEVYNLLGERVKVLFSGIMTAGESRWFVFEAGSLPSGIYLYRAKSDRHSVTRQFILIE